VLDGVYQRRGGEPLFHEVGAPSSEQLQDLLDRIITQVRHRQEHAAVTKTQMRHFHRLHLPAQFDRLIAPVELVGLSRGKGQRNKYSPNVSLALGFPPTHRALDRGIGSAETLPRECVLQTLPIAPLTQRLGRVLVQQFQQARRPRVHYRKALRPRPVFGLSDIALEVLLDGVARCTQAPRNLADAQLVYPMSASDLTSRFHA